MTRFFTKKIVACFFATILLFGFFSFNFAYAATISIESFLSNVRAQDPSSTITPEQAKAALEGGAGILGSDGNYNITDSNLILAYKTYGVTAVAGQSTGGFSGFMNDFAKAAGGTAKVAADGMASAVAMVLEWIIIPIVSLFLAIAGQVLDFAVQYSLYGTSFSNLAKTIQVTWTLIRDTANVCFIFILLYAAIQQILTGSAAKKVLTSVIISAVLINFSLFITKVAIDAGNLVATSLYNQIVETTVAPNTNLAGSVTNSAIQGATGASTGVQLSGRIMNALKLKTFYENNNTPLMGMGALMSAFLRFILFLMTTFMFVFLSVLIIGRLAMLIFLMATSPLGFVGTAIPGFEDAQKTWRKHLKDQVFVAPIFMFFMLLIIRLSDSLPTGELIDTSGAGNLTVLFNYFLIMFLLTKAVSVTKSFSGEIGKFADKIAATATGAAFGFATGGAALIGRTVIGQGANKLANNAFGKRLEAIGDRGGAFGFLADKTLGGIKGVAKNTFDMRNTDALKGTLSGVKGLGLDLAGGNAKAGGTYGKFGAGFAGAQSKENADVEAKAKAYEKSAKDTQERYTAEQTVKEKNLTNKMDAEKDPTKKAELQKELTKIQTRKTAAGIDFQAAEDKVAKYEKEQVDREKKEKDIADREKEINDRITKLGSTASETDKANIQAEKDSIKKAKDDLDKNVKDYDKALDELNTVKDAYDDSDYAYRTLLETKEIKSNYAKHIRTRKLSKNNEAENLVLGNKIGIQTTKEEADRLKAVTERSESDLKIKQEYDKNNPVKEAPADTK